VKKALVTIMVSPLIVASTIAVIIFYVSGLIMSHVFKLTGVDW
jgi:hypothetical protein